MGLQLLLCALRRVGVVAMALLGGMSMTPVSAQYREQRITTAQGTYVLRSDADDDERMEGWSSSLMVHRPDGTELLFAEVGLVVGCWEFTPQVVQVKARSGRQVSVVLLCGTPARAGNWRLHDACGAFGSLAMACRGARMVPPGSNLGPHQITGSSTSRLHRHASLRCEWGFHFHAPTVQTFGGGDVGT